MKTGIFIGRCQPLHDGHRAIISKMIAETDQAFVMLGSANSSGTIKNPWTFSQREEMILAEFPTVTCIPLNDYVYNDPHWVSKVQAELEAIKGASGTNQCVLYGHTKEDNQYLAWIKEVEYVEVENTLSIAATQIRNKLGEEGNLPYSAQMDFDFYKAEKELFKNYPFPETLQFNCADAIVVAKGKVLLIKRKFAPGIGKWALPGGFKNKNESFVACAARELFEETGLDVSASLQPLTRLFDSRPNCGGIPRITVGVYFRITECDNSIFNTAQANDDAAEVTWMDIQDAMNYADMFYDHRDILGTLTGYFANKASATHKDYVHATI